jgi:serine carboxypeptidase-like clade 1
LKGILVGNGVADWNYDTEPALYDFVFTHHLISYELRLEFVEYCKKNVDKEKCDKIKEKINQNIEGINIYDILQECQNSTSNDKNNNNNNFYYNYASWMFKNKKNNNNFIEIIKDQNIKKNSLEIPCIDVRNITKYLNIPEVKSALHVNQNINFELCSEAVSERYGVLNQGSIWTYPELLGKIRILIFSGDTDLAVPYNGNQAWIKNLGLEIKKPWEQWRAYDDEENVSGYRIVYDGLIFATVKGTGHMVPQWKPKEALYLFEKFLKNEEF